jgi:hypothetical protein
LTILSLAESAENKSFRLRSFVLTEKDFAPINEKKNRLLGKTTPAAFFDRPQKFALARNGKDCDFRGGKLGASTIDVILVLC